MRLPESPPPPPIPACSSSSLGTRSRNIPLPPASLSVILAANLAHVVCCLSFGSKLAKRQDAGKDDGRDGEGGGAAAGARAGRQRCRYRWLRLLHYANERSGGSSRVESVSVCVHSQIGVAGRGVGRQEAAQDISSPSAADATFGPWQLRAALPAVVVAAADGVQKAQKKEEKSQEGEG